MARQWAVTHGASWTALSYMILIHTPNALLPLHAWPYIRGLTNRASSSHWSSHMQCKGFDKMPSGLGIEISFFGIHRNDISSQASNTSTKEIQCHRVLECLTYCKLDKAMPWKHTVLDFAFLFLSRSAEQTCFLLFSAYDGLCKSKLSPAFMLIMPWSVRVLSCSINLLWFFEASSVSVLCWYSFHCFAVYATCNVSSPHLNPTVSFAQCLTGHMSWSKGGVYVIAQILGGIFGALIEVRQLWQSLCRIYALSHINTYLFFCSNA